MFKPNHTITAVEIGTNSLKVLMGKPLDDGTIGVIACDEISTLGHIHKGEVVDVQGAEELLSQALNNVEAVSDQRIRNVYVAITGGHIRSTNVIGSVPITADERIITDQHIVEATRNARSFNLQLGQQDIHTFQRGYLIDDVQRTSNPQGMVGNKLTAEIHVIYGNYNKIQTLCTLLNDVLGSPANDVAFSGIADFHGLPPPHEQKYARLIIDMGAGITEYVVFFKDVCVHSGQITVGCEHIANDLSIALRLPIAKCRELIRQLKPQGFRLLDEDAATATHIQVTLGQELLRFPQSAVRTVIKLRVQELLELIREELVSRFLDEDLNITHVLDGGIVLCGGGALIPDVIEIAKQVFKTNVEIGFPSNISGIDTEINSPRYVTPAGLLQLGYRLNQLQRASLPTFRQTLEHEVKKIMAIGGRAFRL